MNYEANHTTDDTTETQQEIAADFTALDDAVLQSVAGGCCPQELATTNLCSCSPPGVECAA